LLTFSNTKNQGNDKQQFLPDATIEHAGMVGVKNTNIIMLVIVIYIFLLKQ